MSFADETIADLTMREKIRIGVVGDIIAGDSPLMLGQGVYSSSRGNYNHLFSFVREFSESYDFLVGNFEAVLVEKIDRAFPAAMKAPIALVETLKSCKFKYLSIANNHTMEYGAAAFSWMCEKLNSAGLETFGHREKPYLIAHDRERNIRFGLFSFSTVPALYGTEPEYYFFNIRDHCAEERLMNRLIEAKECCDYLMVFPHWGNEFMERPAPWQFALADKMVQAGADIILGSHAHIIQAAHFIQDRPVFFCLGNFLSDYFQDRLKRNLFVTISCGGSVLDVKNKVFSYNNKFVIYSTEEKMDLVEAPLKMESEVQYATNANYSRRKVRREFVFYLLKHPQRWIFRVGTWTWFSKRAIFLLFNRRKIKKNPNAVYTGPIH